MTTLDLAALRELASNERGLYLNESLALALIARAEQADALEAELGGVRHAEPEREKLGRLVRAAWVRYC